MDILNRLLGGEFYTLYFNTAALLASCLKMTWDIKDEALETAHIAWKKEIIRAVEAGEIRAADELFWVHVLSSIAFNLCISDCVTYTIDVPIISETSLAGHEALLQKYAAEYTALEFVRGLHMDIYFTVNHVHQLTSPPALVRVEAPELAQLFSRIRANPVLALRYHQLLHLPIEN